MATNSAAISHGAEATSFSQGAVVVLGRFFFVLIFLMSGPLFFFQAGGRVCGCPRSALGLAPGSVLRCAGLCWRPEHFAGLSRKTGRLAHCALPGSSYRNDAQLLGGARSDDGAGPYGHVHEKSWPARRRLADFSIRSGTIQP